MIKFEERFIETKYSGYFWDYINRELYSIKMDGILKRIKPVKPTHFNDYKQGYKVSVRGQRKFLHMDILLKLQPPTNHIIPVKESRNA